MICQIRVEMTVKQLFQEERSSSSNNFEDSYPHLQLAKIWLGLTLVDTHRVGVTQSRQNELKLQVPLDLCQKYIKADIEANRITIISRYQAQLKLTKEFLALDSNTRVVDVVTLEEYQGKEKSVIVMCIVEDRHLSFMRSAS